MKGKNIPSDDRRRFFKRLAAGGIGMSLIPGAIKAALPDETAKQKPSTNIDEAKLFPRNENSLPGRFPAEVVKVTHTRGTIDSVPQKEAANEMIRQAITTLTGERDTGKAWRYFVMPGEKIGLKVNPIAGKPLSTSHAVVQSIIEQLEATGIRRSDMIIWDRREWQLHEAGFTEENYPGIKIIGTERKDENGSFYGPDGKQYAEELIDHNWYYWADVEMEYDQYTLPQMVNAGKYSYFTKIATSMVDKIINIPILKNAGASVTLCMKNLGYGVITNTARLHQSLWADTSAEVCAFPPIRDKVVLNVVDGLKGCFDGGPGANPQFFHNYNTLLMGTDIVAVDRVGYDIVINKRIEMGRQAQDSPRGVEFLKMASDLQLGEMDLQKIKLKEVELT